MWNMLFVDIYCDAFLKMHPHQFTVPIYTNILSNYTLSISYPQNCFLSILYEKGPSYVSLQFFQQQKRRKKNFVWKVVFFSYHKGCALNRRNAFLFWSVGTEILRGKQLGVFSVFQVMLLFCSFMFTSKIETRREKDMFCRQHTL